MQERQEYAWEHRYLYLNYVEQVAASPYSQLDRVEFALISAHTSFEASVRGFLDTRGVTSLSDIADKLWLAGVLAPYVKAGRILSLRDGVEDGELELPYFSQRDWRRQHKLPGLGYCKASFAACLCDPIASNVACLDTHILKVYSSSTRVYRKLVDYEEVEGRLAAEAIEVGLPVFPYQWAVWDWKRGGRSPHDFLWQGGTNINYLPLFSSLGGSLTG